MTAYLILFALRILRIEFLVVPNVFPGQMDDRNSLKHSDEI